MARVTSAGSYYVSIVPVLSELVDPDGLAVAGTANLQSATGSAFQFDPFPDGYACDGYKVYAGTASGTLYLQGTLPGRFNTSFTLGVTPLINPINATDDILDPQTIGVPAFANSVEVFESEGTVNSRTFFGGGKPYTDGYVKVASATSSPILACGAAGTQAAATWQAVTEGSFRMILGWTEGSVDYEQLWDFDGISFAGASGDTMAHCAATIQAAIRAARHPCLYCGSGASTTLSDWTAITNGSFDIWVDGVVSHVTGVSFAGLTTMAQVASAIQSAMVAAGGNLSSATCTWNTAATIFVVKANNSSATASSLLSYLYPSGTGTGSDISEMMKGRETDTAVNLVRRGKSATTAETVAWSTDHFLFTSSNAGQQYRFGYLLTASIGTDISGASFCNGQFTATASLYTPGLTAGLSVQGDGTEWGDWMEGMRFRVQDESNEFLIGRIYDEDLLSLESSYSGDAFFGWELYSAVPWDQQVYITELGNPFKLLPENIIATPVADGDGITAIRRNGSSVDVFMEHHIWNFDGVSITAPSMVSNTVGTPTTASCIEYGNGIAFFTGHDFGFISGQSLTKLDPEHRMKQYMDRLSSNFTEFHGVFDNSENKEFLKWFVGLDSSYKANTCFVFEPNSGNWWLHNVKDANASCMIETAAKQYYMVTGDTYDPGHAIKAWNHIWSQSYRSDGAVDSAAYDKDGIILSVAAATTTAGYLTCATAGATLAQFQAVTAGYFSVTIDDVPYDIGPVNLSTAASLGSAGVSVASLLQAAIQTATGGSETVAYVTDHFVITSGTTTARSTVTNLTPYRPVAAMTDLSGKTMLNGREDHGVQTFAVNERVLTLNNWTGAAANLYTSGDGEEGVWVFVCDTNFRNGQYARIVTNDATTITVSPDFVTTPATGWYWYIGGIVPSWMKWQDWGSPQHRNKVHGIAVTIRQTELTTGNTLAVHEMQDLDPTIRVTKTMPLGVGNDSVQTVYPADKPSNQFGIKVMRPSSNYDLQIDDITVAHRARV